MKHPSIRELFDYWNHRRGSRAAADRADIDPGEIRGILADTFIVTFDEAAGHPFRIAGTRVCALFDQNLKHEPFLDLWAGDSRHLVRDLIEVIGNESVGLMAGVSGRTRAGAALDLEFLALPLVHGGRTDSRVLGAIAPAGAPAWVGDDALRHLILGTFRYVGAAMPAGPRRGPAQRQARLRRGLLVYDGGLTRADASPSPWD